ncbi:Uu.00g009420.m01.CDS01 [Anthostomella pinea]|uniref:Uu.00g009420.m01.CDS01 n=1 Tax=Anthostomella pinea TaxID=933095 RepID=A0AAI8VYL9_9PEZI|nr:Uu.00g009420.m01.CDS01 [Anthostomella pinea]
MLCQTDVPFLASEIGGDWGDRPENILMSTVNGRLKPSETPYSDDLLRLLETFEWPGCDVSGDSVTDKHINAAGDEVGNWTGTPPGGGMSTLWRKVRQHRDPRGGKPAGWYRRLDVSWKKPERLMPFEYFREYAPVPPRGDRDPERGDAPGDAVYPPGDDEGAPEDVEVEIEEEVEAEEGEEEEGKGEGEEEGGEEGEEEGEEGEEEIESPCKVCARIRPETPPLPDLPEKEVIMNQLNRLRMFHDIRPALEIASLEYDVPTMMDVHRYPPAAPVPPPPGGGGDDDDDDGSDGVDSAPDDQEGAGREGRRRLSALRSGPLNGSTISICAIVSAQGAVPS